MRLRLSAAGLIALVACAAAASLAAAEVHFSATVLPPEIAFPAVTEVTYRIEIRTGDRPEELSVYATAPTWGTRAGVRAGPPASELAPSLEGPGAMMFSIATSSVAPLSSDAGLVLSCPGASTSGSYHGEKRLRLPASSTSVLVSRWRLSTQPLFAFTDPRPQLTANWRGMSQRIALPQPQIAGPAGVPMRLLPGRPGRRGRAMMLRGRTDPALAGREVVVRMFGPVLPHAPTVVPGLERYRSLARVRVDRLGRYALRWTPRRRGTYGAYPAYLGEPGVRLRDHGCPIAVRVG